MKPNKVLLLIAVVALFLIGVVLQNSGDETSETSTETAGQTAAAAEQSPSDDSADSPATTVAAPVRYSDLPLITEELLPIEAIDTLILIDEGGPFPFDRDDLVFENREGLLPDRPIGHYREYTVITPGENDRGARRVVAGDDGERYYTQDHYASFLEIEAG